MAYAIKHREQIAAASGLDVLAGIWLLISPFVLHFPRGIGVVSNDVVFGVLIALIALYRTFNPGGSVGASWLNMLLGLWVIVSPWVIGYSTYHTATSNSVILGIVVVILSVWSALATEATRPSDSVSSPLNSDQP